MASTRILTGPTLAELAPSWRLALDSQNKAPRTIQAYLAALDQFLKFTSEQGMPQQVAHVKREHVEAYIAGVLARSKPATASTRYRSLQAFWKWCVEEGEIRANPMANMKPPKVPEDPPIMLSEDELRSLLKTVEGQKFEQRRDMALIRMFIDTGARRSEIAGLQLEDIDWNHKVAVVLGKGGRRRACPFGKKTAAALDRYIRVRRQHRDADVPELWLGKTGVLTSNGIYQVFRRRSTQAGLDKAYPHLFRHGFAHSWLANGGGETDLMALTGWRSRTMLGRYAASAAADRAREAYQRLSPGDRL